MVLNKSIEHAKLVAKEVAMEVQEKMMAKLRGIGLWPRLTLGITTPLMRVNGLVHLHSNKFARPWATSRIEDDNNNDTQIVCGSVVAPKELKSLVSTREVSVDAIAAISRILSQTMLI